MKSLDTSALAHSGGSTETPARVSLSNASQTQQSPTTNSIVKTGLSQKRLLKSCIRHVSCDVYPLTTPTRRMTISTSTPAIAPASATCDARPSSEPKRTHFFAVSDRCDADGAQHQRTLRISLAQTCRDRSRRQHLRRNGCQPARCDRAAATPTCRELRYAQGEAHRDDSRRFAINLFGRRTCRRQFGVRTMR